MNKQEKIIALLLGLALAGWLWHSVDVQKERAAQGAPPAAAAEASRAPAPAKPAVSWQQSMPTARFSPPISLVSLTTIL